MACEVIRDKNGQSGMIICSRGQRLAQCQIVGCHNSQSALCDYPLGGARAGATCDMKLCNLHRVQQPGRDRDYCPAHAKLAREIA